MLCSCGYCNKLPHTWWLKPAGTYSHNFGAQKYKINIAETKSGWQIYKIFSEVLKRVHSFHLPASGSCQHSLDYIWITSIFKASIFKSLCSIFPSPFPLCLPNNLLCLSYRIHVITFNTHINNPGHPHFKSLNFIIYANMLFPHKAYIHVPSIWKPFFCQLHYPF